MDPKGRILLIGGAEDIGYQDEQGVRERNLIYEEFEILKEVKGIEKDNKIEFITTATRVPEETKKRYVEAFVKMDYTRIGFIHIESKEQAENKDVLARINKADVVFFSGGDQSRLADILCGTPVTKALKARYQNDSEFLIAGTSAGAMYLTSDMIVEAKNREVLLFDDIKMTRGGLGLLSSCLIDTHFIQRGRFSRLALAILINSENLGIGLGENTAVIIKNGVEAECIGSGMVVTINGKDVKNTNICSEKIEVPLFIENLKVNLFVKGCRFSIIDGSLIC